MYLPRPRGPASRLIIDELTRPSGDADALQSDVAALLPDVADPLADDDLQLALCLLYELHYHGFDEVDPALEWSPALLAARRMFERAVEQALRRECPPPPLPDAADADIADPSAAVTEALFELTSTRQRPKLATYLARHGDKRQFREYLMVRSVQQLKEADPQTWLIPRLTGRPKAALVEIQIDEYGSGRPGRLHYELYSDAMEAAGLDGDYGAYLDRTPGHALAAGTVMTMLGLHRRLAPAAAGFFAAFEATSSLPSQGYADAARRLGLPAEAALYFDEHVEADSVHEQLAIRELCGSLVAQDPSALTDVVWGAQACLLLGDRLAERLLDAWQAGDSALYGSDPVMEAVPDARPA